MPTVGVTVTPSQAFGQYGLNLSNMLGGVATTMPENGTIQSITCYMAGHGASTRVAFAIWNSSNGSVICNTAVNTVGAGSGVIGGQSFHTFNVVTPTFISSGQGIVIGFERFSADSDEWTENNGGTEFQKTIAGWSGLPVSPFTSPNTTSGTPSFYATYTKSKISLRRSSAWNLDTLKIRRSGVWNSPTSVNTRRSSAWTQVQ
jgi:hypothetical protein